MIREAVSLPLPITATRGGSFTLSMGSATLPDGWSVLLHDAETGITTDLTAQSYTFDTAAMSASITRFTLTVEPSTSTSTPDAGRSTPDARRGWRSMTSSVAKSQSW